LGYVLGLISLGIALSVSAAVPSAAANETSTGPEGQTVAVSKASGIDPAGEVIDVHGEGFDVAKGIYVVVCVNNGEGAAPSPCFGGQGEESASSAWVSSNPPSYAEGMTTPFTESDGVGSFDVELTVAAAAEEIDCMAASNGCVVATMADHTRAEDRSADVIVPLSFGVDESAAEPATDTDDDAGTNGVLIGGAAVVAAALAGGVALALKRRSPRGGRDGADEQ
jgi:hypothetical protein